MSDGRPWRNYVSSTHHRRKKKALPTVDGASVGAKRVEVCEKCGAWQPQPTADGQKAFACIDRYCGNTTFLNFDSEEEAKYYATLRQLEAARQISNLAVHPSFNLHAYRRADGRPKLIGRAILDFRYWDEVKRRYCYVEVKGGTDTTISRWKRKHIEAEYGITVEVVANA